MKRFRTTRCRRWFRALPTLALAAVAGCGDGRGGEDPVERAVERSREVVAAEWSYGQDTLPPAQGEQEARIVDRCRITLPADGPASEGDTTDVECGRIFIGLDAGVDSVWVERLVDALGVEIEERGRIPSWATALEEPVRYLLVRVEQGQERRALERALASDGVRFVDVRQVSRRRP